MRDILHKLLKALKFNRRDWAVFLLALLLAFSIWLIHNLSLRYNDYLKVAVTAVCNIDGWPDAALPDISLSDIISYSAIERWKSSSILL